MKKDQVRKDGEISAEDLEQVSGGMTKSDMPVVRVPSAIPPSAIDSLQKIRSLEPDPWEKPL